MYQSKALTHYCALTAETEHPTAVEDALQCGQGRGHDGNIWYNHMGDWRETFNQREKQLITINKQINDY